MRALLTTASPRPHFGLELSRPLHASPSPSPLLRVSSIRKDGCNIFSTNHRRYYSDEPQSPPQPSFKARIQDSLPKSRLVRALLVGGAVAGAVVAYLTFSDNDVRRLIFKSSIPSHILALGEHWTPDLQKVAAAKALAWFSSSYAYCATLVEEGAIASAVAFLEYRDPEKHNQIPEFIAKMFYHVSSFDGLRDSLIDEKALDALRKLSLIDQDSVRKWTSQCLVLLLTKTRDPYLVLRGVGVASLSTILEKEQSVEALAIVHSLSRRRDRPLLHCERAEGDLTSALASLVSAGARADLALGAVANILVEEGVTVADIGPFLRRYLSSSDPAVCEQLVRCLANLSADDRYKGDLVEDWSPYLARQLRILDSDEQIRLASLVALANMAEKERGARDVVTRGVLKEALKLGPSKFTLAQSQQIARLAANMSSFESAADVLWSVRRGERFVEWTKAADPETRRYAVQAFSQFVKTVRGARDFISSPAMMEALMRWGRDENIVVVRSAVQLIANIAVHESVAMRAQEQVQALLRACAVSEDENVRHEAVRAQASLADIRLKAPKYAEGINLLHPAPSSAGLADPEFDIVFIHGVTGDPISTWRAGPERPDPKLCSLQEGSWARDWIPADFPQSRVISIGYEVFLTEWGGRSIPLKTQSLILLQKLRLASLGRRPIVFICHSFGGLLTKEMLRYAAAHPDEYGSIAANVKGIVFFSVPHFGSDLTHYRNGYADVIFRGNPVTDDLTPSPELEKLNNEFITIAPKVETLAFGEGPTCFGLGTRYDCLQIVSDASSNPGYDARDEDRHRYVKTFFDHREVCKPRDRSDPRYALVHDFVARVARVEPQGAPLRTQE